MAANIFLPGAAKTAAITLNLDASLVGMALSCEVFISKDGGVTKATTGGVKNFTAAASQNFTFPITMPTGASDYQAFFDVYYQGSFLMGFSDVNHIIIPGGTVTPIVWT
jgi:hypothetical protein